VSVSFIGVALIKGPLLGDCLGLYALFCPLLPDISLQSLSENQQVLSWSVSTWPMGYSARAPSSLVCNIVFLSSSFLCAEFPRVFPGSSPALPLQSWLCTSPTLYKWGVGKILVGTSEDTERWSQKCSVQLRGTWWRWWHLRCFPIRWEKLFYSFSVLAAMQFALALFHNSDQH
jgi:hypothetical protein